MSITNSNIGHGSVFAGAAGLLAIAATPVSAAVVFDFASVSATTNASLKSGIKNIDDSTNDESSVAPADGLNATAASTLTSGFGPNPDHAASVSSVTALFGPDAAHGEFIFAPQTTDIVANQSSSLSAYADTTGQAFYNFTLTTPGIFSLYYTINTAGIAGAGLPPSQYFYIFDQTTFGYAFVTGRLSTSGSYTSPILTAGDYQFAVQNYDVHFSQLDSVGTASTSLSGDYVFDIASVAEPATWAMMVIGAGVCGASMRSGRGRRRFLAQGRGAATPGS